MNRELILNQQGKNVYSFYTERKWSALLNNMVYMPTMHYKPIATCTFKDVSTLDKTLDAHTLTSDYLGKAHRWFWNKSYT